ncbi:hypothetical protein ACQQCD_05785 [Pseudarthrobacter sp. J1763]|uniref:hypothetical protein n=1 Tax=Pseudarthrobacter sp. J1763 TaxID=3420445 RepID=UPI003D2AE1F6
MDSNAGAGLAAVGLGSIRDVDQRIDVPQAQPEKARGRDMAINEPLVGTAKRPELVGSDLQQLLTVTIQRLPVATGNVTAMADSLDLTVGEQTIQLPRSDAKVVKLGGAPKDAGR